MRRFPRPGLLRAGLLRASLLRAGLSGLAALLVMAMPLSPAAAVSLTHYFAGIGSAAVGDDYVDATFNLTLVADTDAVEAVSGRPWDRQVQSSFTQLFVGDSNGEGPFVYAVFETPLLVYAGGGSLPFVGVALPDGTRVLEFGDASLAGIDLASEFVGPGLVPSFIDTSLVFATDAGTLSFRTGPGTSLAYSAVIDGAIPVPEPAAWAMLIVGFALTGGAMRRRRVVPA